LPQDGSGTTRQITHKADTYKYPLFWSPDSKKLLWADKKLRLQYVDIESKDVTLVAQATAWEFSDYTWSPDSQWIAYAKVEEERLTIINLYSLEKKETVEVTDGWYSSTDPTFSSDGKFLYFVSRRSFTPTYGQVEWNYIYQDLGKIYLVTLDRETKSPFEPKSDEVKIKEPDKKDSAEAEKKKEEGAKAAVKVKVDATGLKDRIAEVPITAANYTNLTAVAEKLYYIRSRSKDERPKLLMYEFDKQKETELGDFDGFEISADAKKILVGQQGLTPSLTFPLPGSRSKIVLISPT
jgi:tricorn protease